ncbi:hypothetical protein B0F86_03340 [Pseudomonas syringae]|nr:hypothetical protein B0F86_03340 [Pseudomonas syringae]
MGTIVFSRTPCAPRSPGHLSFLTLQRGNAGRDALRHTSAPRHASGQDAELPEQDTHAELFSIISQQKGPVRVSSRGLWVLRLNQCRLRLVIWVPTPLSVKISSKTALGTRPSMMCELLTPP